MKHEVDSENLASWLNQATHLKDWIFQDLDLRPWDDQLAALPQAESKAEASIFLGCQIGPKLATKLLCDHSVVFPGLPGLSFKPYRSKLYSPLELFQGFDPQDPTSYRETLDRKVYESYMLLDDSGWPLAPPQLRPVAIDELMARRLHDHFISAELKLFLAAFDPVIHPGARGVVAIMGGHDVQRDDPAYTRVAELARELARRGFLVASGGGPGLMEAANLGAYFSAYDNVQPLHEGIAHLALAPGYKHPHWLKQAWEVRLRFPSEAASLGIPTWFYGHEPPNVFASQIAKYFENSLREEGLLAIATHGIIFADGNAGTVQEIFQDACQNYYSSYGYKSPMVLLGRQFWDLMPDNEGRFKPKSKPAWQLLRHLARVGGFEHLVRLTDEPQEVLEFLEAFRIPGQTLP